MFVQSGKIRGKIWGLMSLALLLVFASATDASAQNQKNKEDKKKFEEKLKLVPGDESGNTVKSLQAELLVVKSEKLALRQLKRLLKKFRGSKMEPDIWFRMAELYMRRAKSERFFELHRESDTVVRFAPRAVKTASAKRSIRRAIKIYDRIQNKFPSFEGIDLVTFNNAFARQQMGWKVSAEKLYFRLVKNYSYSPLVPDAHLAIGEMNYAKRKFTHALSHFGAIRKYPNSRVYPYGMYKAAWTQYNLRNPDQAIKLLEQVVAYGRMVAKNNLDVRLDLRKEALSDMTFFFEDVYPSNRAYTYFKEQAGEIEVGPYILKLANIYQRHSRHKDLDRVLLDYIKYEPVSPQRPNAHHALVWNYEKLRQRPQAAGQLIELNRICRKDSSWSLAQPKKVETEEKVVSAQESLLFADKDCHSLLRRASIKLALKWHRMWSKNKDFLVFANVAEKAYQIFLENEKTGKKSHKARFSYAGLLFQRKKYREASDQYAIVGRETKQKKLGHDASYGALLSLEKAVQDKWNDVDEQRFQELAKIYIEKNPKGEFVQDIDFKRAFIAYEKGRYNEAAPIFRRIGWEYRKTAKGREAQDLYLDILNIQKNYNLLRKEAKAVWKFGGSKERLQKLKKIHEEAYFAEVQALEAEKKTDEAIAGYQRFAKENPQSPLADKAWWNASQLLYKKHDYKAAADAGHKLYKMFPNSEFKKRSLVRAAETYESMGLLKRAAATLEDLAALDKEKADHWRLVAANFYGLSRNTTKARLRYQNLSGRKDRNFRIKVLDQWTLFESQFGTKEKYEGVLGKVLASGHQPQASEARLYFVEDLYKRKRYEDAFLEAKKVLNMKDGSASAKAGARFIQASILEEEYLNQSVKARVSRIALVLAIKTERLDKAQRAFQAAMRYGDDRVTVESMRRLSTMYSHYAKAIRTMTLPDTVAKEEVARFRQEIENLAIPMEEKSVEALVQALEAAKRAKLRDGSVARIQLELDKLNMRKRSMQVKQIKTPPVAVPRFERSKT